MFYSLSDDSISERYQSKSFPLNWAGQIRVFFFPRWQPNLISMLVSVQDQEERSINNKNKWQDTSSRLSIVAVESFPFFCCGCPLFFVVLCSFRPLMCVPLIGFVVFGGPDGRDTKTIELKSSNAMAYRQETRPSVRKKKKKYAPDRESKSRSPHSVRVHKENDRELNPFHRFCAGLT